MCALPFLLLMASAASAVEAPQYLGPTPKAEVRRVVTLAPSLTETVLALGAGEIDRDVVAATAGVIAKYGADAEMVKRAWA